MKLITSFTMALTLFTLGVLSASSAETAENMKEIKSTTEYSGKCIKASIADQDVTAGCYGWGYEQVDADGKDTFLFSFAQGKNLRFVGAEGQGSKPGHRVIAITGTRLDQASQVKDTPGIGTCMVDGDLAEAPRVDCKATAGDGSLEIVVQSTQPASFNDRFPAPSSPDGIDMRYMDLHTAVCTKVILRGIDRTIGCKGVTHAGFGLKRVDFLMGIDGHLVSFSGDVVRGEGTSHYVLYVNRLYYDKASTPASGKCTWDGDPEAKSTLVCDGQDLAVDSTYSVHAEFDISGVKHLPVAK